ncbi:hypothetical protein D3C87_926620 [compost metagenome]
MFGRRSLILATILALSIYASYWVSDIPESDTEAVMPTARATEVQVVKVAQSNSSLFVLDTGKLERTLPEVGDFNPFNAKSWYVPPPAPPPAPPPKPTAPPLPFKYIGKLEEAGGWTIYLSKGEQSFAVKKGETFDAVYRIDDWENGNLVIVYIPLSIKQYLPVGGLS